MDYSNLIGKEFKRKDDHKIIERVLKVENTTDKGTIVVFESAKTFIEQGLFPYISIENFFILYEGI